MVCTCLIIQCNSLHHHPAPLYSQTGRQDTVVTQPSYTAPAYHHQTDDSAFYESTHGQYHSHPHHHHLTGRPPVTAGPTPAPLYDNMAAVSSHSGHQQRYGNPAPLMDHHGAMANTPALWASGSPTAAPAAVSYGHPLPGGSHAHHTYYQQQQQQQQQQLYHQHHHQHQQPRAEVYNQSHQLYQVR